MQYYTMTLRPTAFKDRYGFDPGPRPHGNRLEGYYYTQLYVPLHYMLLSPLPFFLIISKHRQRYIFGFNLLPVRASASTPFTNPPIPLPPPPPIQSCVIS